MRFIVFGAGAIGGVLGARLHQGEHDVTLIARGAHHDAIKSRGLTLKTPKENVTLRIPVAANAQEAGIQAGDVVLLCVKSQDTIQALADIRAAAPEPAHELPIVLLQNGTENERVALRFFSNVYGCAVLTPTAHLEPGVVLAYAANTTGQLDIGRIPSGVDQLAQQIAQAFRDGQFDSTPQADIMQSKYAKLLLNLANSIQAVCGNAEDDARSELVERVRAEGREILTAAGIAYDDPHVANRQARWDRMEVGEIEGKAHEGGSTWQSITRGAGSVETDYLNGEIVMLARQHGRQAPINELLQSLAQETLRRGHRPGWIRAREILDRLAA